MLQLSKFPIKTLKSEPKISDNLSTSYLLQAGFIRQEMAWIYNYLPLWLRVLKNIQQIIREEMNAIGAQEILMSSLSGKESWEKTQRWDKIDVLFKLEGSWWKEYALNPTHEEVVTPLMSEFIQSYKDLNQMNVYQFQTKFRNEARAKSGLLRWREFLMKDAYSFNKTQEDLDEHFEQVRQAYVKIFDRLWIWDKTLYAFASWGAFSKYSYEFQTKLSIWEDTLYVCRECWQAHNDEIVEWDFVCVSCKSTAFEQVTTSEVWNIFKLGTRFSDAFWLQYMDEEWKSCPVYMGCYGIWISRLMWVIAESFMDDKWLVWPANIAPATHYIIVLWEQHLETALLLAKELEADGGEVILDDRSKVWFGQKAWDADLLWIPYRIVISDATKQQWWFEIKSRISDEVTIQSFEL